MDMEVWSSKCIEMKLREVLIAVYEVFVVFIDYVVDKFLSLFTLDDFQLADLVEYCIRDSDMDLYSFKREAVNAHNNFRTMHGCPPLSASEELAALAQSWADKLAEKGFLQYSENPNVGENISLLDLNQASKKGEGLVKEWYREIGNYNYGKPGWKKGAYRFSQLLWKSTTEIGVGIAKAPGENKAYVVVNYRPAGNNNMPGEFERNVLPPQKKAADKNSNTRNNVVKKT